MSLYYSNYIVFVSLQYPFACGISRCPKRYTDPTTLGRHVKRHHGMDAYESRRHKGKDLPGGYGSRGRKHKSFSSSPEVSQMQAEADSKLKQVCLVQVKRCQFFNFLNGSATKLCRWLWTISNFKNYIFFIKIQVLQFHILSFV